MVLPFERTITSEEETADIAREFSTIIEYGDVILLNGNLGAGKTFFVKAVCSEYGIGNVSSPSFAIVNEYSGTKKINHFDFYRIRKVRELYDIGFTEYLNDESITFIEWADLYPEVAPSKYYKVEIRYLDEPSRKIILTKNE